MRCRLFAGGWFQRVLNVGPARPEWGPPLHEPRANAALEQARKTIAEQ
jgi:hypothetical protein